MLDQKGFVREVQYKPPENPRRYPFNLNVLNGFERLKLNSKVTFLVGENGSGKSTLIEAIAIAYGFNAEGGSLHFNFSTKDSSSELHRYLTLIRTINRAKNGYFLRAESFYNVATQIEELDAIPSPAPKVIDSYGGRSLHEQSHGESFLTLMNNRFSGSGFYVLDEPEAALSAERQLSFLLRLHELVEAESQFIIATHSPIILSYPHSTIYSIEGEGIVQKDYEETEQFQFTKMFVNDYKRILYKLFGN